MITLAPSLEITDKPPDDQSSVKELLRAIANGDRRAFADFHERFSGMVYATAVQVLHSHEDAEDCVQDVFSSLWKKAGMYVDDRGKPSTWLSAMARNRAIDKLRARQRRGKLNDSFEAESRVDDPINRLDPSRQAGLAELGGSVRSAVLQLTAEQSQAIRMAFFDGLTQQEIAKKTGEPLGTIKARIRRGLGKLRTIVKE
jgi:RNA polymerase sigma-70 factor (ECF subfamily)